MWRPERRSPRRRPRPSVSSPANRSTSSPERRWPEPAGRLPSASGSIATVRFSTRNINWSRARRPTACAKAITVWRPIPSASSAAGTSASRLTTTATTAAITRTPTGAPTITRTAATCRFRRRRCGHRHKFRQDSIRPSQVRAIRRSRRAIPMGANTRRHNASIQATSGAIGDTKGVRMRSSNPVTVLVVVAALAASAGARLEAQEFTITEATSPAGLAVEQIKPRTIAFLDRPSEELIDPDAGLIRFEDWVQAKPVEKQFLTPFPSYLEPNVEVTVDGVLKRFKEKLHMYVGEARFVLARPPGSINL